SASRCISADLPRVQPVAENETATRFPSTIGKGNHPLLEPVVVRSVSRPILLPVARTLAQYPVRNPAEAALLGSVVGQLNDRKQTKFEERERTRTSLRDAEQLLKSQSLVNPYHVILHGIALAQRGRIAQAQAAIVRGIVLAERLLGHSFIPGLDTL